MNTTPFRTFYLLLFVVIFIAAAWNRPKENYDMVFYAASAFSWQQQDTVKLQQQTFAALKQHMSEEGYREVTQASKPYNAHYRSTVFSDVEAFRQQLPYYQPRVIYSGVLFALNQLGLNIVTAMKLVSVGSMVLGLWILFSLFREQRISAPLFYLAPWLICSLGYFDLARFNGPDVLAFLLIAVCIRYLLSAPNKVMWFLPLLVLVRTDLIIFVAIVSVYLYRSGQKPLLIGLVLLAAMGLLKLLQQVFGSYSWGITVLFTFVDLNPYPLTLKPEFTFLGYGALLIQEIKETVITDDRFLAFLILAIYPVWLGTRALFKPYSQLVQMEKIAALATLGVVYVIAHIVLFPASWERFFMAQYVLVFLITITGCSEWARQAIKARPFSLRRSFTADSTQQR